MRTYVIRRLLHSAVTLFGVSLVVFGILRVLPGDPARMMLPDGGAQSAVDEMSRQLGLTEPLYVQYVVFLQSVIRGDFGQSFQYRAAATAVVAERVWPTVHLSLAALALTVLVGVPIGILAAAATRDALRLRQHLRDRARPVAAELLARDHADPAVRRGARLAADVGLSGTDLPGAAGDYAGGVPDGAGGAAHAIEHARGAGMRVRPDGASKGLRESVGVLGHASRTPRSRSSRSWGSRSACCWAGR